MNRRIWKATVTYKRWCSESTHNVNVVARNVEDALERAYVSAYKEHRWERKYMDAKLLERLDLEVFV